MGQIKDKKRQPLADSKPDQKLWSLTHQNAKRRTQSPNRRSTDIDINFITPYQSFLYQLIIQNTSMRTMHDDLFTDADY